LGDGVGGQHLGLLGAFPDSFNNIRVTR
jgi:hypothetical protein